MLDLGDVTLVAVFTVAHELTLRAVDDCTRQARFGAVKLFTDMANLMSAQHDPSREFIQAGPFADLNEAGRFTVYELPSRIETSHVLFVQWDSWILDPSAWRPEFLEYDYIGAVWGWYPDRFNVGNSGFSMRSKRLLDFLAAHERQFPIGNPEDATLCRRYRPVLEQLGFRWAPLELAHEFSFERRRVAKKSFGYHGMFNWPDIMSDAEIDARLEGAPAYVTESQHHAEMRALMAQRADARQRHEGRGIGFLGSWPPSKLDLSRVTLVAVDAVAHDLTAMALNRCLDVADFGEVIILSDRNLAVPGASQRTYEALSAHDVAHAYIHVLPWLVETEFMMMARWDSWIIDPEAWRDDFLGSDYIGAPWGWLPEGQNVGSSAFSIRSIRVARTFSEIRPRFETSDDAPLCREHRPELERQGFKWAPPALAGDFCFERGSNWSGRAVFATSGMFNWPIAFSADEIEERLAKASAYVLRSPGCREMRAVMAEAA